MELSRFLLIMRLCSWLVTTAQAQTFKHLTVADGLPDGNVRSITQDQYGFLWFGTDYGLCRFDGRSVRKFTNVRHQTNSLPSSGADALFKDADGNLWVGMFQVIARFDYKSQTFQRFALPAGTSVTNMLEVEKGTLWIATDRGILYFDRRTLQFTDGPLCDAVNRHKLWNCRVWQLQLNEQGSVLAATDDGMKLINPAAQTVREFRHNSSDKQSISSNYVTAVAYDRRGGVWIGLDFRLGLIEHINLRTGHVTKVDMRQFRRYDPRQTRVNDILVANDGRVWFAGNTIGLIQINPATGHTEQYEPDLLIQSSLPKQHTNALFQDRQGLIWIGTEGVGLSWFNPKQPLFTVFRETQDARTNLPANWARAAVEDKSGGLWLGTSAGLATFQPDKGTIERFTPANPPSPLNSVRSLARDSTGDIWIGTNGSVNRFSLATRQLKTFTVPDTAPRLFCWDILVTRKGTVWAAANGGLRQYDTRLGILKTMEADSLFRPYAHWHVRSLAEDPDGGLWIGTFLRGLLYWHPQRKIVRHYQHQPGNHRSLVDDNIASIAVDARGQVWVATFNGLCVFEASTQTFRPFDTVIRTNHFSGLLVDDHNRLWMGTDSGLYCLEADRRTTHHFDVGDGLPTDRFNDQRATRLRTGQFCYPTLEGFVLFNPNELLTTEQKAASVSYLTKFSVFNKPYSLPDNLEAVRSIDLKPSENFFSFEWVSLFYDNPEKCRYAYRLVGFDRDWIYPDAPVAQYTNVPGGDYDFEFKTSLLAGQWNGPLQRVHVHVGTIFYRTWWFIVLSLLVVTGIIGGFYQYRLQQAFRLTRLQMRASQLEKDNALVKYQNLINQLNPHFLFNSLAILNSMIGRDAKMANQYLKRLTKVYRFLIENDKIEVLPLEKELQFTTDFLSLLTARYDAGLTVDINVAESLYSKKIVPVTLQNLIENAIKHNATDVDSPLRICIYDEGNYLVVDNNLQKRTLVKNSNRKGLNDLKTLYRYLTDDPLLVEETNDTFRVKVPLLSR